MGVQMDIFTASQEPFKFTKPIKVIELFAGYGSQMLAFEYLKANASHFKICEWAVPSIMAYNLIHIRDFTDYSREREREWLIDYLADRQISMDYNNPMTRAEIARKPEEWLRKVYNSIIATKDTVDITRTHGDDFYMEDRDKYNVLMSYSFPCLTNDSLILTMDGYKEFKDLKVGEYVLTKSNTWQKIAKKFDNGIHKTYIVKGMAFENLKCTANHKFYVREKYWEKGKRKFKEPDFKEVKDITRNDFFGIPVNEEEIPFYTDSNDFWYVIGYYLGDGWLSKYSYDIKLAASENKLEKLVPHLKNLMPIIKNYTINNEGTCYKARFCNKNIHSFIEKYIGSGAGTKRICGEILRMPKDNLKALIQGYIDSDGCFINGTYQFSSINRNLVYSISFIANKLYHTPTHIYKVKVNPKKIICGREVNQKDWYLLRFKSEARKQDKAFYENGYIWYPFTHIEESTEENVYNMEIENDHSYIVLGCISKNCQDLSLAGYCKGMEENSGTRSSMLWQVSRILYEMKEMNQLPDVLMMENVPPVCSGKNYKPFNRWLQLLDGLGYTSFVKILSATEFGVPQTRKRCFVVSILGNKSYEFPTGWKLDKCLRDIVEKEVDERYYLTEKQMRNFEIYDNPLVMGLSEIERVGTTHSNFNCRSEIEGLNGAAATLSATDAAHPILLKIGDRIRKITPIECFRLMGVRDEDYNKIKDEFPPSKLYHLAGDSIVVDVLMNIFKQML